MISSINEPVQPGISLFCKSNFYSFFRVDFNFSLQLKIPARQKIVSVRILPEVFYLIGNRNFL